MRLSISNKKIFLFFIGLSLFGCSCQEKRAVLPVVHISYDTPIEGYIVFIDWNPTDGYTITPGDSVYITWGPAEIVLHNSQTKKDITLSSNDITIPEWIHTERVIKAEESIVLHYEPFGTEDGVIPPGNEQLVFFSDIDFDGEKELILNYYKGGAQWANTYTAYNITEDGVEMIDYPPFFGDGERFEDYRFEFNVEKKTVKSHYRPLFVWFYRVYQFDGSGRAPVLIEESELEK